MECDCLSYGIDLISNGEQYRLMHKMKNESCDIGASIRLMKIFDIFI